MKKIQRFFNIHSVAEDQKMEGDPLGKHFISKKSLTRPKKLKGGSLISHSILCYAEKDELVQFASPDDSIWDQKIS